MPVAHAPTPALSEAIGQRARRAAKARRLMSRADAEAERIAWHELEAAPDWLALDDEDLLLHARRVGAVLCAPALRLWIDAARIAAARLAVGDLYWHVLLAQPDPATPGAGVVPALDAADTVAPMLAKCGLSALLATLPEGAVRHAAMAALARGPLPVVSADLARATCVRAEAVIDHMRRLSETAMTRAAGPVAAAAPSQAMPGRTPPGTPASGAEGRGPAASANPVARAAGGRA